MMFRKKSKFTFILFGLFLTLSLTPQTGLPIDSKFEYRLPVPEIETLSNGLEIVWFRNDQLPLTNLALLVHAGFRDDPAGKSGLCEVLSATLPRGAAGQSALQFAKAVESLGASHYETTDEESFTVGIQGLASDANELLRLLSQLATEADLVESEIQREKGRILDRWKHIGDYSETLASLAYRRALTANSPYGRGSLINPKELQSIRPLDVKEFYKKFFTPKNSTLVVVGRVDKKLFKDQILAKFGKWEGPAPERTRSVYTDSRFDISFKQKQSETELVKDLPKNPKDPDELAPPQPKLPKTILMHRPGASQAQVRFGMPTLLATSPDYHALVVANSLLGEYFNSRLNSLIRDQMGLTYSISSSLGFDRELGQFSISSSTRNETVGLLVQKTMDALNQFKNGPISQEEVDAAKSYLIGGFPLSASTMQSVASRWLAGRVLGLSPTFLNDFVSKIQAVDLKSVQTAIQRNLDFDQLIVVIAGDKGPITKALNDIHLIPAKEMSASDLL